MKKFIKNLNIAHAFIIMTILSVVFIGGVNYYGATNLGKGQDYTSSINKERVNPILDLFDIINTYSIEIVDVAIRVHNHNLNWDEGTARIQASRDKISKDWDRFFATYNREDIRNQALVSRNLAKNVDLVLDRLNRILLNHDQAALDNLVNTELYPVIDPLNISIREIITEQEKLIRQIEKESEDLYNTSYSKIRMAGFIAIFILIALATFIVTTLRKTLNRALDNISMISTGDLTVEIKEYGNDEIGQIMHSIKTLVENLRSIIEVINTAANNISITSHELSGNSQSISQGATEQAASVEEIAASMEEISANIIQTAKNATATEQISVQAGHEFEDGKDNIDTTFDAIKTIAAKISIIGEIAFQTNILALNAAVEAARAGEHGKGFGVVAAEVGKLADRSKIAAAEIDAISKSGVELSFKSKELLKIALPNISKTIKLVKEISFANAEQSAGVNEINSGIQTLNHVTQQNAAASEEMATVAEELAAQAMQLTNSIGFFKIENMKSVNPNKTKVSKFIEQKSRIKREKSIKQKGIELNMDSSDELDNEFETF